MWLQLGILFPIGLGDRKLLFFVGNRLKWLHLDSWSVICSVN